jgi:hypothetical protein
VVRRAREGGDSVVESFRDRRIMSSRSSGGRGGVCCLSGREDIAERRISDFVARRRWVCSNYRTRYSVLISRDGVGPTSVVVSRSAVVRFLEEPSEFNIRVVRVL